jgi:hypothetical protein
MGENQCRLGAESRFHSQRALFGTPSKVRFDSYPCHVPPLIAKKRIQPERVRERAEVFMSRLFISEGDFAFAPGYCWSVTVSRLLFPVVTHLKASLKCSWTCAIAIY